ncbi:MAG: adenylate/guanylate cyclase domain-containing protein [Desulfobacteraceae bacterium]
MTGYIYIRNSMLKEWQEVAILRLERAAHQVDMRLQLPRQWMKTFSKADNEEIHEWILGQLREQPGINQVKLTWWEAKYIGSHPRKEEKLNATKVFNISVPQYFYPPDQETVGLRSVLLDKTGNPLGKLEVIITYKYLMEDFMDSGWLQTNMACLVDETGFYLAHSDQLMKGRHYLGETQDPLELAMLQEMKDKPFGTILDQGYTPDQVIGFYRLQLAPWVIMLHAPGSQILAPVLRFRFYYLIASILGLAVILGLIRLGVGPVVSAIQGIAQRARLVAQGQYGDPLPEAGRDEIGQLTRSFNNMVAGLKERDFISNTFGRYVDQEIAQQLLSRPEAARLGGEKREVVIFFSDLRNFTPLAESLTPEATLHLVNRHFAKMIEIIQQGHGIIVDFLGDAILAFFDPLDAPLHPRVQQALRCALKMQKAVAEENASESDYPPLQMGIGLHVGEVVVGNIGSESRTKYGIVGAPVNLTHRIQAQAQGGEVVISEAVYHQMPQGLVLKRTFLARLKGIQEPVTLYVVQDLAE